MNFIRPMKLEELKKFYKFIQKDFPVGEYAPFPILYRQLRERVQEGLVFCSGEKDLAYSICAVGRETGYILIRLLAVFDGFRGQGIGSAFIDEIRLKYKNKRAIIDFRQFIENTKI